jgi:hypothetical protein
MAERKSIMTGFLTILAAIVVLGSSGCSIARERAKDEEGGVDKEMSLEEKWLLQEENIILPPGVEKDGVFFVLDGTGETREDEFTWVWPEAIHICEEEDELRIEKIEILREDGKVILTLKIPKQLQALSPVGKEYREMRARERKLKEALKVLKQIERGEKKPEEFTKEMVDICYGEGRKKLSALWDKVRQNSLRGKEELEELLDVKINLMDFKKDLKFGDIIPVSARAYFIHRGERVVLENTFYVRYSFIKYEKRE